MTGAKAKTGARASIGALGTMLGTRLLQAGRAGLFGVAAMGFGFTFWNTPLFNSSVAAALVDPISVLAARSPGARGAGALSQSKARLAKKASAPWDQPVERVLNAVRTRPSTVVPAETVTFAPVIGGPGDLNGVPAVEPLGDAGGLPIGGGFPGGFGPVIVGGGGGGGGGGTTPGEPGTDNPTPTPTVPVVPIPAVPEPATWLMMLLGFGSMGFVLRSRRVVLTAGASARLHG